MDILDDSPRTSRGPTWKIRRRLTGRIRAVSVKTLYTLRMALEQLQRFLTQVDLDAIMAQKDRDDDSVFYIHSNCHSHSPTWTRYESGGFLRVECSECSKTIAIVRVAEA